MQFFRPRFERILIRVAGTLLKGFRPRSRHSAELCQLTRPPCVDGAPVTFRPSWGEPLFVVGVVDALANSVDPSEAQSLVQRLAVSDTFLARPLFVKSQPQLGDTV